jgi:hypothetical protein
MAEKRLFHATIKNPNNNQTDYEAFYEAHTVNHVRQDAGNRHVARGNRDAFTVEHDNLTRNPTEFYRRLGEAENKGVVKHEKVKGLGRRWEVQKDEDSSPFGKAADDNGGVPPSLHNFPDDEEGWSAKDEENFRANEEWRKREDQMAADGYFLEQDFGEPTQEELGAHYKAMEENYPSSDQYCDRLDAQTDDDRVGLPDDEDDYESSNINPDELIGDADDIISYESSYHRPQDWNLNLRAKPEFYDIGAIMMSDDPIAEMTRQDHMHAVGGFEVPLGSENPPKENGKKPNTGDLKIPTIEELDRELEILKRDPATYEHGLDEEEVKAYSRSYAVAYFI